jgi:hypothetical protein
VSSVRSTPGRRRTCTGGIITRQAIRRGTFGTVKELTAAIGAFTCAYHDRCQPFTWTKNADELLAKINRQRTNATQHQGRWLVFGWHAEAARAELAARPAMPGGPVDGQARRAAGMPAGGADRSSQTGLDRPITAPELLRTWVRTKLLLLVSISRVTLPPANWAAV